MKQSAKDRRLIRQWNKARDWHRQSRVGWQRKNDYNCKRYKTFYYLGSEYLA